MTPTVNDVLRIVAEGFEQNPELHCKEVSFCDERGAACGVDQAASACLYGALDIVSSALASRADARDLYNMADRALGRPNGCWVDFNDAKTTTPKDVADLCRKAMR